MAAPLESVTWPLTCATAVTWAFVVTDKARNRKAEASKHTLANVDRDALDITTPWRSKLC
jgi:hypothetical protein